MSRLRRTGLVAVAVAAGALLSACDKPIPEVTVLAGNKVTTLKAQNYCHDSEHCKRNINPDLPVVKVRGGTTLEIDVPEDVATSEWFVTLFSADENGQTQTLLGTGRLHDTHHASVPVPIYRVGASFSVGIQAVDGLTSLGQWQAGIEIVN